MSEQLAIDRLLEEFTSHISSPYQKQSCEKLLQRVAEECARIATEYDDLDSQTPYSTPIASTIREQFRLGEEKR